MVPQQRGLRLLPAGTAWHALEIQRYHLCDVRAEPAGIPYPRCTVHIHGSVCQRGEYGRLWLMRRGDMHDIKSDTRTKPEIAREVYTSQEACMLPAQGRECRCTIGPFDLYFIRN